MNLEQNSSSSFHLPRGLEAPPPASHLNADLPPRRQEIGSTPGTTPRYARPPLIEFFGLPSSGKGTQSKDLATRLGVLHFSTGEYFRDQMSRGTPQGLLVKSYVDRGEMVPDDVTVGVVREVLARPEYRAGVVLDGFPRTQQQAELFEELRRELQFAPPIAVELMLDEVVARERMRARATTTPEARSDDVDGVFERRLQVYRTEMPPLREWYLRRNFLVQVSGFGAKTEVSDAVWRVVEPRLPERLDQQ